MKTDLSDFVLNFLKWPELWFGTRWSTTWVSRTVICRNSFKLGGLAGIRCDGWARQPLFLGRPARTVRPVIWGLSATSDTPRRQRTSSEGLLQWRSGGLFRLTGGLKLRGKLLDHGKKSLQSKRLPPGSPPPVSFWADQYRVYPGQPKQELGCNRVTHLWGWRARDH